MKETIQNPDLWLELGPRCWQCPRPHWSHFEIEHLPPLSSSENPIIDNLVKDGYSVHPIVTSCFLGFPTREYSLTKHFVSQVREEFQIDVGEGDGFLRFRFDAPKQIFLCLFYIKYEKQGRGLARKYFRPIIDAMFHAGVMLVWGEVSSSYYPSNPINRDRLTEFYVCEAGFEADADGRIWRFLPYLDEYEDSCPDSPYSQAMPTFKTLESASAS